ncbi:MAG: regulatory protein ArsR, partial [Frankiales bacterium]|nr:regulatory protein ArsR [Frankiales bacterium]
MTTKQEPDAVLRALADPHRRQVLRLVQHRELAAGEIAAGFTMTQQAVSQHLAVLKSAGLLHERREGTRRLYSLRPESLEPVQSLL